MDVLVGIKVFVGITVLAGDVPVETGTEVLLGVAVLTGVTLAADAFDPVNGECPLGPFVAPVMGTNATVPVPVVVTSIILILNVIAVGVIVGKAVTVGVDVYRGAITIWGCFSNL